MKIKKSAVVKSTKTVPTSKATASKTAATTPPAKTKAKGTVIEAADKKEPRVGVNFGKRTQMRVMAFQDLTFAENDAKVRPTLGGPGFRTDEELAQEWRSEFPQSRAVQNGRITADMVRAVRHLYNSGTGGHGTPGTRHASTPYVIQDGKRVTSAYVRTRTVKADKAETTPAAPSVEAKTAARKGAVLVAAKVGKAKAAGGKRKGRAA